jgi:hypothetical protein
MDARMNAARGRFRRRVEIDACGESVTARVEDDFHHFSVTVSHCDGVVTAIQHEAWRHPWSLCPSAGGQLTALVGSALAPDLGAALALGDVRANCTHLFDLACLAIASAARSIANRRFDMTVEDRVDGRTTARLVRDDGLSLALDLDGADIVGPPPYAGLSLKRGFVEWATRALDRDQAEAAILLRRAAYVSNGRRRDLDERATAADGARNMGGCFVMRPGIAERALRMRGGTRDFSDSPDRLLAESA